MCYELHDGMYECDCTEGFELNKNGYSCQGKIENDFLKNFIFFFNRFSATMTIVHCHFSSYKVADIDSYLNCWTRHDIKFCLNCCFGVLAI